MRQPLQSARLLSQSSLPRWSLQQESQTFRLEGSSTLRIQCALETFEQRLAFAHELLERLTPQQEAAA